MGRGRKSDIKKGDREGSGGSMTMRLRMVVNDYTAELWSS